jgi:hypothetical protein
MRSCILAVEDTGTVLLLPVAVPSPLLMSIFVNGRS